MKCVACRNGHTKAAMVLLDAGSATLARQPDGRGDTPLMLACERCDYGLVRQLLKHGADPLKMGRFGDTALMRLACSDAHPSIVTLLLCDQEGKQIPNQAPNIRRALVVAVLRRRSSSSSCGAVYFDLPGSQF